MKRRLFVQYQVSSTQNADRFFGAWHAVAAKLDTTEETNFMNSYVQMKTVVCVYMVTCTLFALVEVIPAWEVYDICMVSSCP